MKVLELAAGLPPTGQVTARVADAILHKIAETPDAETARLAERARRQLAQRVVVKVAGR